MVERRFRPAMARRDAARQRQAIVGRLYDSHAASLYRYALMLLADAAAAEDAIQQVFAALMRPDASLEFEREDHYLRRAVRNECYSALRRRRDSRQASTMPLLEPVDAE